MLRVLSVHLALKSYDDFGCCLLTSGSGTGAAAEFPNSAGIGLKGVPHAEHCADVLAAYCEGSGANVLLLDGPQGWKDPSTRSEDCRICERLLNTTGKVGLPGRAQPATFLPFAQFCIDLFTALARRGGVRPDFEPFTAPTRGFLLLETFPTAAWVALGLEPLKPREKVKIDDPAQACRNLQVQVPVTFRHATASPAKATSSTPPPLASAAKRPRADASSCPPARAAAASEPRGGRRRVMGRQVARRPRHPPALRVNPATVRARAGSRPVPVTPSDLLRLPLLSPPGALSSHVHDSSGEATCHHQRS